MKQLKLISLLVLGFLSGYEAQASFADITHKAYACLDGSKKIFERPVSYESVSSSTNWWTEEFKKASFILPPSIAALTWFIDTFFNDPNAATANADKIKAAKIAMSACLSLYATIVVRAALSESNTVKSKEAAPSVIPLNDLFKTLNIQNDQVASLNADLLRVIIEKSKSLAPVA